jgi:Ca-activated chloride channel homolog
VRFQFPWAFLLLAVVPLLIWLGRRGKPRAAVRFSSVKNAGASGRSWRTRLIDLPLAVRVLALVLLTVGLARPQQGREEIRDVSNGIAIEMVVDRSGSMGQEFIHDGSQSSRLEAVKRIFKEFVSGNGKDLPGRQNDLIGMVIFARHADTTCPLTLSHGALDRFIDSIQLVKRKEEDGTAIGDGLALAAARLQTAGERLRQAEGKGAAENPAFPTPSAPASGEYQIKSKVIILLTDGQNNAGRRTPIEAARAAREWGIKVYCVGIGGRDSFMTVQTPFGAYKVPGGPGVDEETLKAIAEETGGAFWMADSGEKLREIYKEIDKLERTEIESVRHMDYSERFSGFVLAALAALLLEQVLRNTLLRRVP